MKISKHVSMIGAIVSMVMICGSSRADDKNQEIMQDIFTKLGKSFQVGQNVAVPGSTFLVLTQPGILVDPGINFQNDEDRYTFFSSIDTVMNPHWIYQPSDITTTQLYEYILTYHQTPPYTMSESDKQKLADAQSFLYTNVSTREDHPRVSKYYDMFEALLGAKETLESWKKLNPGQNPPARMVVAFMKAKQQFESNGDRLRIEGAWEVQRNIESKDPNTWWAQLRAKFDASVAQFNATNYGLYSFYPKYDKWFDPTFTWSKFNMSNKDIEEISHNEETSVGGGLGGGWGLWRASASYGKDTKWEYKQNDVSEFSLQGEFAQVFVRRPWLDTFVFRSTRWDWSGGSPISGAISDGGDPTSGATPQGHMPFLPVALLIARNVSLSGSWSHEINKFYEETTGGGGKIGWGPFSFGGRTQEHKKNTYKKAQTAGNTITFESPQIIGFYVRVLPKSPSPDFTTPPSSLRDVASSLAERAVRDFGATGFSTQKQEIESALLSVAVGGEPFSLEVLRSPNPLLAISGTPLLLSSEKLEQTLETE